MSSQEVTKAKQRTHEELLNALIAALQPRIRNQFLKLISGIKDDKEFEKVVKLIEAGRVDEAMTVAQRHVSTFASEVTRSFVVAGDAVALHIAHILSVTVGFDQTNERAVNIMRQSRLRMISQFTRQQTEAVRTALTEGIAQGLNPRVQAQMFRDSIGLTANQVEAVNNYRRLLQSNSSEALDRALRDARFDPTVQAAIDGDRILTADQIDKIVERYRQRFINYRAEVIARTEALRAVHTGSDEAFRQAIDEGVVGADELEQEWLTAEDERVRHSHQAMDHQLRDFGEPFTSGNGYSLRYPGDPDAPAKEVIQCRCLVTTRIRRN